MPEPGRNPVSACARAAVKAWALTLMVLVVLIMVIAALLGPRLLAVAARSSALDLMETPAPGVSAERSAEAAVRAAVASGGASRADQPAGTDTLRSGVWKGQTAEQLRAALGAPDSVEEHVRGSLVRAVWAYSPADSEAEHAGLVVTLENGVVASWSKGF